MNTNPNTNEAKDWKSKREIAAYFKCHPRTINNFMRRRILPFVKVGRFVRFDPEECDRALARFKLRGFFGDEEASQHLQGK